MGKNLYATYMKNPEPKMRFTSRNPRFFITVIWALKIGRAVLKHGPRLQHFTNASVKMPFCESTFCESLLKVILKVDGCFSRKEFCEVNSWKN